MSSRFNILALSGGGARGLFTATALAEIEKRFETKMAASTDIICGTSIGGILALALAAEIPASKMLEIFNRDRKSIFPPPGKLANSNVVFRAFSKSLSFIRRISRPAFDSAPLRKSLQEVFEDRKISDLKSCIIVPAINFTNGSLRAFKTSHHQDFYQDAEQRLVDVALATSAAPTYFPNHVIGPSRFVDGGLVANNPVLMGVVEAIRAFDSNINDIYALCIGNMGLERAADHTNTCNLGYSGWDYGKKIVDLSLSINEKLHYDMARILLAGRIETIDKKPTADQAHLLTLDNADDCASEILQSQAKQQAGTMVNSQFVKEFMNHRAATLPILQQKLPE